MKNLALGFVSLRPAQLQEHVCDSRENEYLICLKQLLTTHLSIKKLKI